VVQLDYAVMSASFLSEVWRVSLALLIGLFCLHPWSRAQEGDLDKSPPKGITPEQVIQRFTAKEKEWKNVRQQYTFRQTVKQQALDGESELGEYRQVADISYRDGKRIKQIVFSPQASIEMSKEDLDDLETRSSFTISQDELPEYSLLYIGQQKMDELHCYVFDVAPKQIEKDKRYFQGRIWVDDQDFQIVKNTGKSVPDIKIMKKKKLEENLFPRFTTWREQIDGKYWFPTFSSADDTLHFNRSDIRIKQTLKFTNYQRMSSTSQAQKKSLKP
jgi:hypothetical protein